MDGKLNQISRYVDGHHHFLSTPGPMINDVVQKWEMLSIQMKKTKKPKGKSKSK